MAGVRANRGEFFKVRGRRPDHEARPLWLRYLIAFALAFAITGCATTSASVSRFAVEREWISSNSAAKVSQCIAANMAGAPSVSSDGEGHFIVDVANPGGGVTFHIGRFDVYATPTGS